MRSTSTTAARRSWGATARSRATCGARSRWSASGSSSITSTGTSPSRSRRRSEPSRHRASRAREEERLRDADALRRDRLDCRERHPRSSARAGRRSRRVRARDPRDPHAASVSNLGRAIATFERVRVYDSTARWTPPRLVACCARAATSVARADTFGSKPRSQISTADDYHPIPAIDALLERHPGVRKLTIGSICGRGNFRRAVPADAA